MSDLEKKISEALAACRAENSRKKARALSPGDLDAELPEAAAALARAIGATVRAEADGGAVPHSYKWRAEADFLAVSCRPDGTANATAWRCNARKISHGDCAGWQILEIPGEGLADLADRLRPFFPPRAIRCEKYKIRINADVAEVRRAAAMIAAPTYADAAREMAENARKNEGLDRALGEHLTW